MTALWIVALAALIVAVTAFVIARRTARQLAQVTEMYWQLKFDHGELKTRVDPSSPPTPEPKQTFVPLSRVRSASAEGHAGTGPDIPKPPAGPTGPGPKN
jgi:hypothetical protein